jgi:hypothetical protein
VRRWWRHLSHERRAGGGQERRAGGGQGRRGQSYQAEEELAVRRRTAG